MKFFAKFLEGLLIQLVYRAGHQRGRRETRRAMYPRRWY
jgi:hypothetical protein